MMFSVLRQELDSLVRVVYLLSISDLRARSELINLTLSNEAWAMKTENGKSRKITDREMVEVSDDFFGWTRSVYKLGCAFIHLSNFHDYEDSNPFDQLSSEERADVLAHMRKYHGGPTSDCPSFKELQSYLPQVLEKVSGNLECYIEKLEENAVLDAYEI